MTRDEQLIEIDNKYSQEISDIQASINQSQIELSNLIGSKQELINSVNEYHDALETKQRVDVIVAKGEPVITKGK